MEKNFKTFINEGLFNKKYVSLGLGENIYLLDNLKDMFRYIDELLLH